MDMRNPTLLSLELLSPKKVAGSARKTLMYCQGKCAKSSNESVQLIPSESTFPHQAEDQLLGHLGDEL